MNEAELKSNPKLDSWQVQDLNLAPDMHLETETYDAVLISFAIQYFKFPEFLLAQFARALKPGGKLIISWGAVVYVCSWCSAAARTSGGAAAPHAIVEFVGGERECCLLVLNSVTSTPQFSSSTSLPV
jgi:SAM-dependent methyltransferase